MIILEAPYVSVFLQKTVAGLKIPVLKTEFSLNLEHAAEMQMLEPEVFFTKVEKQENPLLYSNSENSAVLLNRYCPQSSATQRVNRFKNKSELRKLFANHSSAVWFRTYTFDEICTLDVLQLPKPFVVKPLRGFASICIHSVFTDNDWQHALAEIKKEVLLVKDLFPDKVVSLQEFMIERYISGKEIAIDAYFDQNNEPVILNILHHLHNSPSDMSDRLYITSAEIIRNYYDGIMQYLNEISQLCDLRNFPFHMEMMLEDSGAFVPIEINPMRFMGFCVADVEYYFYGINPYEYYFGQKKPDWTSILATRQDKIYGMFGIDIPKHLNKSKITFNYEKFIAHFSKPIHYTKMDYQRFPMSIYMFAEVQKDNFNEFEHILYSDLMEFIEVMC